MFNISIRHKAVVARAAAKAEAENTKVIMVAYEYSYQDHEYIIRTTSECKSLWGEPERVHRNMKQNIQATQSTYAQHN